jgi:glutaconate CoA-transferase subunit B
MAMGQRAFVDKLPFITSMGHGPTGRERRALGVKTKGPTKLITDLCVFEPDDETKEMTVVSIHPGASREKIIENCGWAPKFAANVAQTPPPTARELDVLRDMQARTKAAHAKE